MDLKLAQIARLVFLAIFAACPLQARIPCQVPAQGSTTSAKDLRQMEAEIGAAILGYRDDSKLPRLKLFRTSKLQQFCKSPTNYVEDGVHDFGDNPMTGTSTVYLFDAGCPSTAVSQLKEIASKEHPHGKNGKPAIDDAQRLSVEICPLENPSRYRVVVGYWYSKLGAFLDALPRGKE